jgi:hypothetical protein
MFGNSKRIKELESEILLLKNELQREKQNSEIRRLDTLLDFFKKSVKSAHTHRENIEIDLSDVEETPVQKKEPRIDEVLISKEYAHKIDDLHKIDFVTKEDMTRLYTNLSELINAVPEKTLSHMVSHFNKDK